MKRLNHRLIKLATIILAAGILFIPHALAAPNVPKETEIKKEEKPLTVKEQVVLAFPNDPVMVRIAGCESNFRQFSNGAVLRGKVNSKDVGIFQVNEMYHLETSKRLGFDIHTIEGNIAYAKHLYNTAGTTPWNWSKGCWS